MGDLCSPFLTITASTLPKILAALDLDLKWKGPRNFVDLETVTLETETLPLLTLWDQKECIFLKRRKFPILLSLCLAPKCQAFKLKTITTLHPLACPMLLLGWRCLDPFIQVSVVKTTTVKFRRLSMASFFIHCLCMGQMCHPKIVTTLKWKNNQVNLLWPDLSSLA